MAINNTMSKTTKLWINDKLELRWNEWPTEPKVGQIPWAHYKDALAKAKEDSIPLEDQNEAMKLVYANKDKNGISILTSMYADSFVEINSSVELFVYGLGAVTLSSGQEGKNSVWVDWAGGRTNVQRGDIVARLKPVEKVFIDGEFNESYEARVRRATGKRTKVFENDKVKAFEEGHYINFESKDSGAMSFTEGQVYSPTVTNEGEHYVARGIKERILAAFEAKFTQPGHAFAVRMLREVLDDLKIK